MTTLEMAVTELNDIDAFAESFRQEVASLRAILTEAQDRAIETRGEIAKVRRQHA